MLQFLGMFRAELLDLREIMGFLRMGSSAAVPPGGAAAFQVPPHSPLATRCFILHLHGCALAVCAVMPCPLRKATGWGVHCTALHSERLAPEPSSLWWAVAAGRGEHADERGGV